MVPSKSAINSSCCYYEEGKEREWGLGVGSWKCLCICACVCMGAGTGGHVLSAQWGDGWLRWGRSTQAQASLEGTIVLANEVCLSAGAAPSAFIISNSSLGNSHPPEASHLKKTDVGLLFWGEGVESYLLLHYRYSTPLLLS